MTDNEMKFLLTQWGESFTTSVITDIATNITKTPNDSIVLAVAIKQLNKKVDGMLLMLESLKTQRESSSGFDVPPITKAEKTEA